MPVDYSFHLVYLFSKKGYHSFTRKVESLFGPIQTIEFYVLAGPEACSRESVCHLPLPVRSLRSDFLSGSDCRQLLPGVKTASSRSNTGYGAFQGTRWSCASRRLPPPGCEHPSNAWSWTAWPIGDNPIYQNTISVS